MRNRGLVKMVLLTFVTLGIYAIYWQVSTKIELNKRGSTVPTAWLLLVPIVNIWWLWKYSEAVDKETNGTYSTVIAFILLFVLGPIGMIIIQHEFNKGGSPVVADTSVAPAAPVEVASPIAPEAPSEATAPVAEVGPTVEEPSAPEVAEVAPPEEETRPTGPVSS